MNVMHFSFLDSDSEEEKAISFGIYIIMAKNLAFELYTEYKWRSLPFVELLTIQNKVWIHKSYFGKSPIIRWRMKMYCVNADQNVWEKLLQEKYFASTPDFLAIHCD